MCQAECQARFAREVYFTGGENREKGRRKRDVSFRPHSSRRALAAWSLTALVLMVDMRPATGLDSRSTIAGDGQMLDWGNSCGISCAAAAERLENHLTLLHAHGGCTRAAAAWDSASSSFKMLLRRRRQGSHWGVQHTQFIHGAVAIRLDKCKDSRQGKGKVETSQAGTWAELHGGVLPWELLSFQRLGFLGKIFSQAVRSPWSLVQMLSGMLSGIATVRGNLQKVFLLPNHSMLCLLALSM